MITTGTVIKTKYNDFDGIERVGLFLVLYTEKFDTNVQFSSNFLACKITTQMSQTPNYCYPLLKEKIDFLDKDCMVTCSKLHTFTVTNIDLKKDVLGHLSKETMLNVYKQYRKFQRMLEMQLEAEI